MVFETFEAAESYYYGKWYSQTPDFEEALKVALWSYETYPEHEKQIMLDLGILYFKVGKREASLAIFQKALDQGIWYPKEFLSEFWDAPWFQPIVERWTVSCDKDRANSEVVYEFLSPESLSNDKPLFIALHGWGEDIPLFKQFWKSQHLEKAYNTVYIQSSQMIGAYHYKWSDYEWAKKDIKKVLSILESKHDLKTDRIYLGGFSEGATTAIQLTMDDDLSIKGFIALNPDKPDHLSLDIIREMKTRGVAGGIITGDQDQSYNDQLQMKAMFDAETFPLEWIVTKDFGHWFPKDLSEKIDTVLLRFNN